MNRRTAIALVVGAALLLVLTVVLIVRLVGGSPGDGDRGLGGESDLLLAEPETFSATLYFPDGGRFLYAEERELPDGPEDRRAREILEALLAGPQQDKLYRPLPETVQLGGVYFGDGGIVFVDLRAPDQVAPPTQGSTQEMLSVYSVVNSLTLNLESCRGVAILWNGVQRPSFAGHVDTARPLAANPGLVASTRS